MLEVADYAQKLSTLKSYNRKKGLCMWYYGVQMALVITHAELPHI